MDMDIGEQNFWNEKMHKLMVLRADLADLEKEFWKLQNSLPEEDCIELDKQFNKLKGKQYNLYTFLDKKLN